MACVGSIILFIQFTNNLLEGNLTWFDEEATQYLFAKRTDDLTTLMTFITNMGSVTAYLIWLPIIFMVVYLCNHRWSHSIEAIVILISAFLLNLSLKAYYGRLRPDKEHQLVELTEGSLSYPSGHSMTAMAFYGFVIYLLFHLRMKKSYSIVMSLVFGALIFFIGVSRVYLGAHYPTDIIAGFVAGFIWLMVSISILRYFQYRKTKKARS